MGLAWLLAGVATAGAPSRSRACAACHLEQEDGRLRRPAVDLPRSVHADHEVGCTDCHGGDGDDPTLHAHERAGFRSKVAAGTTPAVCGDCHADARRMASERLDDPTDQLELYRGSVHGMAFARGNERAATCSRCHGAHDIRRVRDPGSPVSPSRVAATCGGCHSDAELMDALGLPHDQELQWQNSVHGRAHAAWSERERADGGGAQRHPPTCNDCHMDHGVEPRERAILGCAECHLDEWDSFRAGPHEAAFEARGFLPCVDCHGSHEIAAIDPTFIGIDREASCRRCHAEGQEMFDTIRRVAADVRDAELVDAEARRLLSGASAPERRALLSRLDAARHELRVAAHTLDPERIHEAARAQIQIARPIVESHAPAPAPEASSVAAWLPSTLVTLLGVSALGVWFARRRAAR